MALLTFTDLGIYCPQADVYIDPWRPVKRAFITHGHSDHARWGHGQYLSTHQALPVIRHRLGNISIQGVDYGQHVMVNGVKFSFHPAGHIPGSAQIRVAYRGEIWVVSGDYKVVNDGLSEPFEPVRCHHFITESTFGLPIFTWKEPSEVYLEIKDWWQKNAADGKVSIISAYALGKAQRIINHMDRSTGPIFTHGAIENTNRVLRAQGYDIAPTTQITAATTNQDLIGGLVIAPPSAIGSSWTKKMKPYSTAFASGWMMIRGMRRRRAADKGFILSDHADWQGLNSAIKETGAENIYVTHGYTDIFTRWLREQGYNAHVVSTAYTGENLDEPSQDVA